MQNHNDNITKSQLKALIREIVKGVLKEAITLLSGMEEMSGTGAASPVSSPMAFGKKKIREADRPPLGVYPANYAEVPHYIRIKRNFQTEEYMVAWFSNGKFNDDKTYYTDDLGDAYDTFKAMQPQVDNANTMAGVRTTEADDSKTKTSVLPYRFIYVGEGSGNVYGVSEAQTIEQAWEEFKKITVRMAAGDASDAEYDQATVRKDDGYWAVTHPESDEGGFLIIDVESTNPLVRKEIGDLNLIKYANEFLEDEQEHERNNPFKSDQPNLTEVEHISYQAMYDQEIKAGKSPQEAAQTVLDVVTNGTWAVWDTNKVERAIELIQRQLGNKSLSEMTTTSGGGGSSAGTTGYNIPGAFSKKGGSEAGVAGSRKLGYELTPIGRKDMEKRADKLLESQGLGANFDKAQAAYDAQEPEDDCEDGHDWKSVRSDGEVTLYRCKVCGK